MPLERDLQVLEALSAGPATLHYLHATFYKKEDGKLVTPQAFYKSINRLVNAEYIWLEKKPEIIRRKGYVKLAILTKKGTDLVCRKFNINRDHIRNYVPKSSEWLHDMVLSDIIRKIRRESASRKTFRIEYIHDDRIMKRNARLRGEKLKGKYFPDLKVRIHPSVGSALIFCVELDAGSKGPGYWGKKISAWREPSIVIALESKRAKTLKDYAKNAKIKGTVCISTLMDFDKTGITRWIYKMQENEREVCIL